MRVGTLVLLGWVHWCYEGGYTGVMRVGTLVNIMRVGTLVLLGWVHWCYEGGYTGVMRVGTLVL